MKQSMALVISGVYQKEGNKDWGLSYSEGNENMAGNWDEYVKAWADIVSKGYITPVIFVATYALSKKIVKPIDRLMRHMNVISTGEFIPIEKSSDYVELNTFTLEFNTMIDEINKLMNDVYKMEIANKESQLMALQQRINPHFLFNSLQLIQSMAVLNQTEQIYNVFDNLLDQVEKELTSRHLTFENRESIRQNLTLCDMENYIKHVIKLYIETLKQKDDSTYIVDLAKQYAKEHLKEEISLEKIEGELNISRNYFCCLFKEATGETFWDYITRIRVEKAKELLGTNMKNYEIILEVGYENPSYLSKVFKKYVGLTPTQYRKKVNKLH